MKKIMFTLVLLMSVISGAMAQNDAMYVYCDGVVQNAFAKTEIDSITYNDNHADSEYQQTIWSSGFAISADLNRVDSICFANLSSYSVPETFVTCLDSESLNNEWEHGLIDLFGNFSCIKSDSIGGKLLVIGNIKSDESFICQYDSTNTLYSMIWKDYSITFANWRDYYVDYHIVDEKGAVTCFVNQPIFGYDSRARRRIEGVITTNTNDHGMTSLLSNLYTITSFMDGLLSGSKLSAYVAGAQLAAGMSNMNGLEFALNVLEGLKTGNWIGTALTSANHTLDNLLNHLQKSQAAYIGCSVTTIGHEDVGNGTYKVTFKVSDASVVSRAQKDYL